MSKCFTDDGKVVKAVSVIRDNWDTEEVVLEELTVFQVRQAVKTVTHEQIHSIVRQLCEIVPLNVTRRTHRDLSCAHGRWERWSLWAVSCFQWKIFVWKNASKLKNRYRGTYFPRSPNQTSYEAEETKRGKRSMREAVKIEEREEKDRRRRGWWGERRRSNQISVTDSPQGASQCVEHLTLWQRTTSPRE